jgi:hypothetical protein
VLESGGHNIALFFQFGYLFVHPVIIAGNRARRVLAGSGISAAFGVAADKSQPVAMIFDQSGLSGILQIVSTAVVDPAALFV